jgi:uncharacterized delta-60 repeat protein
MSLKGSRSSDLPHPLNHRTTIRLRRLLTIAAIPLLFLLITAAVHAQSALDGFDPNPNFGVNVVLVQPDGKILIGGEFTTVSPNGGTAVTRNRIARLNRDGTLDTAFNPDANGTVLAIALQADGKILVGGEFHGANCIGGQTRNYIARLDPTTGQADSFNPGSFSDVSAIIVQPDGKILVAGSFNGIGGQTRLNIARLDPATGLADSFDPRANSNIYALALQPDGRILASGLFTHIGGQLRNRIARLDPTTGLADSLNSNANDAVYSLAVQPDVKILAGGRFSTLSPNGGAAVTRNGVARLEVDGRLDRTLNLTTVGSWVLATAFQPDGKILIGVRGSGRTTGVGLIEAYNIP